VLVKSRSRHRVGGGLAALAVATAIAGCGSISGSSGGGNNSSSTSASPGASSAAAVLPAPASNLSGQIDIGAAIPLTGSSATIGLDQQRGIELAAAQVNHDGGVLGKKLVVDYADTQAQTVQTVQAAQSLVTTHHVPVVIGEFLSNDTIAMGKYLQKQGVVEINPGSSSPDIASIGNYSFSTIGLDSLAGKLAAEHLYSIGDRKLAFLGPNNAYGSAFAKVVATRFQQLGGKVVASILYTEGQSSYSSELQQLESSGADVYVYASYEPDDVTINKEAYQMGMDTKKFYGIYLSICVQGAPGQTVAGQNGQDLAYTGPNGQSYLNAYMAAFHQSPVTPYSGYTYDAVMMAAKAIEKAHSASPSAIRGALISVGQSYQGATGAIAFDSHGQRESAPYAVLTVQPDGSLKADSIATVSESSNSAG
jgi:branched-chain amino acid transport system substrate-binding protein